MLTNKITGFPSALLICFLLISATVAVAPQQKDNALTAQEKKEGWKLLFDGKSLNGWRPYNNATADGWRIQNGELFCPKEGVKNRADLITNDKYEDFELAFDWKVDAGANSGVIYRVDEGRWASYESGPEYQLIDDNGYSEKLEDWQKSGSDYAMHPPTSLAAKAVGEFNHSRIVAKKGHIEHWLNGVKVADFEMWTPEWDSLKAKSKWKDVKQYGQSKSGHVALQDHGGGTYFKNIKIRKI